jgi:hypothetical protein
MKGQKRKLNKIKRHKILNFKFRHKEFIAVSPHNKIFLKLKKGSKNFTILSFFNY